MDDKMGLFPIWDISVCYDGFERKSEHIFNKLLVLDFDHLDLFWFEQSVNLLSYFEVEWDPGFVVLRSFDGQSEIQVVSTHTYKVQIYLQSTD